MTEPKLYTWFAGSGRNLSLTLTLDDAQSCSHPGPCDADVVRLSDSVTDQTDQWDAEELAAELKEYGAWDEAELSDHEANVARMVWLACNDIDENPEFYSEVEE